jgi:hypothetical protein
MRRSFFGGCAALLATTAQPASAATEQFCFTRQETRLALSYITPLLVEGFVKSCTPHMSADALLLKLGPEMAANYRAVANPTDADISALLTKIGGVVGDPPPDASLETLTTEIFSEMAKDIKPADCAMADRFVADLVALPAANMLGLVESGIMLAELKDREKKAKRTKKPIAPSVFCEV